MERGRSTGSLGSMKNKVESPMLSQRLGYIDVSKKDVNPEEKQEALVRYTMAKKVHSMLQHVCFDERFGGSEDSKK